MIARNIGAKLFMNNSIWGPTGVSIGFICAKFSATVRTFYRQN